MPELRLLRSSPSGEGLSHLVLDAPVPGHTEPGQYVVVEPGGARGFFALANDPGAPAELLVKHHGDAALRLIALTPGEALPVSEARGPGFGVLRDDRPLVVLVAGSGISAVRPVVRAELARGLPRPVDVVYGVFTPEHRSFLDELEAWTQAGVSLHQVYDRPPPGWTGPTGFVQHVARDLGLLRPEVSLVLCGFPQMVEEGRQLARAAGIADERVRTNF